MKIIKILLTISILTLCQFSSVSAEARQIDTIIIHHTDSEDVSVATIDTWHKARGWDGIGYHYLIHFNGNVESGRAIEKAGAHAKGRNAHSIGIALIGYNKFTPEQIVSLSALMEGFCKTYPIKSIERHHEKCPGPGLDIEAIAKKVFLCSENK